MGLGFGGDQIGVNQSSIRELVLVAGKSYMVDQGRLAKVIFALMAAMTGGALILLALEGQPIEPMAFSLSSQTQITTIADILYTENGIDSQRWQQISICYRNNNDQVSEQLGVTGDLAVNFHFVLADGSTATDGQIFPSRQWQRQMPCIFGSGGQDDHTIKICLLGDTRNPIRTPAQAQNLEQLVANLVRHCRISEPIIWTD